MTYRLTITAQITLLINLLPESLTYIPAPASPKSLTHPYKPSIFNQPRISNQPLSPAHPIISLTHHNSRHHNTPPRLTLTAQLAITCRIILTAQITMLPYSPYYLTYPNSPTQSISLAILASLASHPLCKKVTPSQCTLAVTHT